MTGKPKKPKKSLGNSRLLVFFIFMVSLNLFSSIAFDIKGFVDTYQAVRLRGPYDWMSSRTRLRLEIQSKLDQASTFVSFNLTHNNVLPSRTGLQLREAYLEYTADGWDMRIGRQIVVWGKADGVQILDLVSPVDYTEFLAQDYDDIRTPVDALKFRLLWNKTNLELICVPFFTPADIPFANDNPWAVKINVPEGVHLVYKAPLLPQKKLANSEFFGKLSFTLPGIDFALSGFYTWDDFGVFHRAFVLDAGGIGLELQQEYFRVGGFGAEFSKPVKDVVIRGEAAFLLDKWFRSKEIPGPMYKKNTLRGLIGIDWFPGHDWIVSGQLIDYVIFDHEAGMNDDAHTGNATLLISKEFFRNTLTISNMLYLGMKEGDFFNRLSCEYTVSDGLQVLAGIDLLGGTRGFYGQYRENTEAFFKVKYSF